MKLGWKGCIFGTKQKYIIIFGKYAEMLLVSRVDYRYLRSYRIWTKNNSNGKMIWQQSAFKWISAYNITYTKYIMYVLSKKSSE